MRSSPILVLFLGTLAFAPAVMAAVDEPVEPAPQQRPCEVNFATGPTGKGYSKVFADIKEVCGQQVSICEVTSEGGLQNLDKMAAGEADVSLVSLGTLMKMRTTDGNIAKIQVVLRMNDNLLHIPVRMAGITEKFERQPETAVEKLAAMNPMGNQAKLYGERTVYIQKFSDLKGRLVGLVGSAKLWGEVLDGTTSFGMQFKYYDGETADAQAIADLKAGNIAAFFTASGWPNGPINALSRADGIDLANYDLQAFSPYQIVTKNYQKIGANNRQFLADPNLLVTNPFNPKGKNAQNVAALKRCIMDNLVTLQEGKNSQGKPFQPAWRDLGANPEESFSLPKFVAPVSAPAAANDPAPASKTKGKGNR